MKIDLSLRSRLATGLLGLAILLAAGCQQLPGLPQADLVVPDDLPVMRVRRVASGQTLEVVDTTGTSRQLRLLGLDAPDLRQAPWGDRARQALEALTLDRTVRADIRRRDRFGRDWSYVWLDGQLANERLVAAGWALAASDLADPDYARQLQRAQERARLLERGIWDPAAPLRQSPRNFRARSRNFSDNESN